MGPRKRICVKTESSSIPPGCYEARKKGNHRTVYGSAERTGIKTNHRLKEHPGCLQGDQGCHSDTASLAFQHLVSWRLIWLPVERRHHRRCLCGKRTTPPSSFLK